MKIIVVFIWCCFFTKFIAAQEDFNAVERALHQFTGAPGLESAAISFKVVDIVNNEVVASHLPNMALPTASIMKLFTTAGSFELVPPSYVPSTRIYIDGEIDSLGVLNGNIWVRGGGDPSLGSRFFEKQGFERDFLLSWCSALQSLAIKKVKGSVIVDASEFGYGGVPEGWTWGDMGNYYGAGPSGIVLFDNTTFLDFQTSKRNGDATFLNCMRPHIEGLNFRNEIKSGAVTADNSLIFGGPFSYERFGTGWLPTNKASFEVKASIPDPEWLMAQEFQTALAEYMDFEQGPIAVRSLKPEERDKIDYLQMTEVLNWEGKTLPTIAFWVNQRSVNLFAEQLVCQIAYQRTKDGSTNKGLEILNQFWKPIIGNGFIMADGSGLSRKNAASAHHFTALLAYMYKSKHWEDFSHTLPVAGKSGTMSTVCRGQYADGKIAAKSGTMSRIKSYSGYVDTASGKKLAFALIVNNHTITNAQLVREMEKLFNAMAKY